MNKSCLLIPFIFLMLACGLLATPTPTDSGITGNALVGPMCPVLIEGQECPDKPYQATLTVNTLSGTGNLKGVKIVQFQTDEDGFFKIPLGPGETILILESPEGKPFPYGADQPFVVRQAEYTRLIVLYDSGIR